MMKIIFFALVTVAVGQVVSSLDIENSVKWRPVSVQEESEMVYTVKKVLQYVAEDINVDIVSVDSLAYRPLMIGREYRALYQAVHNREKTELTCDTRIFVNGYRADEEDGDLPFAAHVMQHYCQ